MACLGSQDCTCTVGRIELYGFSEDARCYLCGHDHLYHHQLRPKMLNFSDSPVSVASAACREYTARVVETLRAHRFVDRKNLDNRRASDIEECVASFFCDSEFYKVAP